MFGFSKLVYQYQCPVAGSVGACASRGIALFEVCHGADALFLPFGENAFRVLEARLAMTRQRDLLRTRTSDNVIERNVEVLGHLGDDVGGLISFAFR